MHIFHAFLESAGTHPIGESHAALVEADQAAERGELFAESPIAGLLPEDIEMRHGTATEHHVERTVTVHLVGDVDVPILGVVRVSHAQACDLARIP